MSRGGLLFLVEDGDRVHLGGRGDVGERDRSIGRESCSQDV